MRLCIAQLVAEVALASDAMTVFEREAARPLRRHRRHRHERHRRGAAHARLRRVAAPTSRRARPRGASNASARGVAIGHDAENVADRRRRRRDLVGGQVRESRGRPRARAASIPVIPRAEMLAELMRMKYGIAVAGTHGKTTTTSLLAAVLARGRPRSDRRDRRQGARARHATRGSARASSWSPRPTRATARFLLLSPTIAVVTNIDPEHLDHYGDHRARARRPSSSSCNRVPFYGLAVLCLDTSARARAAAARAQALRHLRHQRPTPTAVARDLRGRRPRDPLRRRARRRDELGRVAPAHARPPQRAERARGGDRGRASSACRSRSRARSARRVRRHPPPLRGRAARRRRHGRRRLRPPSRGDPRHAARRARGLRPPARRRVPAAPLHAHPRSVRRLPRPPSTTPTMLLLTDIYPAGEERIEGVTRRGALLGAEAPRPPRRALRADARGAGRGAARSRSVRATCVVVLGAGDIPDGGGSDAAPERPRLGAEGRVMMGAVQRENSRAERLGGELRTTLVGRFGARVRFGEPLSRHTSFRIGGPADVWVEVETAESSPPSRGCARAARRARVRARQRHQRARQRPRRARHRRQARPRLPVRATGGLGRRGDGACGRRGTVQEARLDAVERGLDRPRVRRRHSRLGRRRAADERRRLRRRDRARRRAARGRSRAKGASRSLPRERLAFRYRRLDLPRRLGDHRRVPPAAARGRGDDRRASARRRDKRKKNQPLGFPNAGSIFKNPPGAFAGRLIEAAGVKGRARRRRAGVRAARQLHRQPRRCDGRGRPCVDGGDGAAGGSRSGIRLEPEVKLVGDW